MKSRRTFCTICTACLCTLLFSFIFSVQSAFSADYTSFTEDFETGDLSYLPWTNPGAAPWFVQSATVYGGTYAAQTPALLDDQVADLQVVLNITSSGFVQFKVKAYTDSWVNQMKFRVDGVNYGKWDGWYGDTGWVDGISKVAIEPGIHTFTWQYEQNNPSTLPGEAVWIDDIIFPPFNTNYLTAGFSGSPVSGYAPLIVTLTDSTTNSPVSWAWDFGDSATSTEQNPVHIFESAGTYTVGLTATTIYGTDDEIKTGYITADTCPNPPVAVGAVYYDTITEAYADPLTDTGDVLLLHGISFSGDLVFSREIDVVLAGGNNCEFTASAFGSRLSGSLTVSAGMVTVENLIIL
jgi:PKD repeat protein